VLRIAVAASPTGPMIANGPSQLGIGGDELDT
jgi:hypothetical protein